MRPPAIGPPTSTWHHVKILLRREGVLGLNVYVASVPDRAGNALLGLTLFTCAVVWSLRNGVLGTPGHIKLGVVFVDALLLYMGTIAVANMLRLIFGQIPAAW